MKPAWSAQHCYREDIRLINYGNYDKAPAKRIEGYRACAGYDAITAALKRALQERNERVIVLETYTEVNVQEILEGVKGLNATFINAEECMYSDREYTDYIRQYLTDDRVFGIMNTLNIRDFYWNDMVRVMRERIRETAGTVVVYGVLLFSTVAISGSLALLYGWKETTPDLFFAGALLFALSDLVLSGTYFGQGKDRPVDIILNYASYYPAQFLIAASLLFLS